MGTDQHLVVRGRLAEVGTERRTQDLGALDSLLHLLAAAGGFEMQVRHEGEDVAFGVGEVSAGRGGGRRVCAFVGVVGLLARFFLVAAWRGCAYLGRLVAF